MLRNGEKSDLFTAIFNEVLGGFDAAIVVICGYFGSIQSVNDSVKKNERDVHFFQSLQVCDVRGLLRQRHHDAIYPAVLQQFSNRYFFLHILVGQVNQDVIPFFLRNGLNAINNGAEKIIDHFRNHHRNGPAFLFTKTAGQRIDLIVQFFGLGQYSFFCFNTYFVTVAQRF